MTTTRIEDFHWMAIADDLDRQGWTTLPKLLTTDQSDAVADRRPGLPLARPGRRLALGGLLARAQVRLHEGGSL